MIKTRFVIYGQGRTGGTLLASLLDSHPQVRCYGELFHPQPWQGRLHGRIQGLAFRHPLAYLMTRVFLARRPVVGFKLLINQNERRNNLLAQLAASNWRVIHLRRADQLARLLSAAMLRTTQISHSHTVPQSQSGKITIAPDLWLHLLQKSAAEVNKEARRLQDIPHLALLYEEDLANTAAWPATAQRLFTYLDLPSAPLRTDLVKTWEKSYADLIANYAELMELARQHGYGEPTQF